MAIPVRDAAAPSPTPPAAAAGWRPARLLSAPHRLGFFAGALLLAVSALWWSAALVAPQLGLALPWAVAPTLAHGLVMAGSFMPLFIVGFLFTAGPKWLGQPDVPARVLLPPVAAMGFGWAVVLAGVHLQAALAAVGVAAVAAGWALLLARFVVILRASRVSDRRHAAGVAAACVLGLAGFAGAAVALTVGSVDGLRSATLGLLWGFLAPVFAIVSHRMLPFFTAGALEGESVWRPFVLLAGMLAALLLEGAAAIAAVWWWPLPSALHALLAAVEAPAALGLLALSWRWGLVRSMRVGLLAMLHGGFVWLGVSVALAALSHARVAAAGEGASLGLAPLHALTVGYLGATLVAMACRVAAGHSGRTLVADRPAWLIYAAVQAAALGRVAAAQWPDAGAITLPLAATAWAVGACGWALRYGGWLGRPRVDGRPG